MWSENYEKFFLEFLAVMEIKRVTSTITYFLHNCTAFVLASVTKPMYLEIKSLTWGTSMWSDNFEKLFLEFLTVLYLKIVTNKRC